MATVTAAVQLLLAQFGWCLVPLLYPITPIHRASYFTLPRHQPRQHYN
jgi:hypothetical protein